MAGARMSTRSLLRLYEEARRTADTGTLEANLALLQSKDVDLSIRLGAVLAFDALLIATAVQPIVASPGAPLALDAGAQPGFTLMAALAVAILALSGFIAVYAITLGEEFSDAGLDENPEILIQRLFAAYCASIDRQSTLLRHSIRLTVAGLLLTGLTILLILGSRLL
jgi:hypothetical protein